MTRNTSHVAGRSPRGDGMGSVVAPGGGVGHGCRCRPMPLLFKPNSWLASRLITLSGAVLLNQLFPNPEERQLLFWDSVRFTTTNLSTARTGQISPFASPEVGKLSIQFA